MPNQIAYKASSKHGHVSEATPMLAAVKFFQLFPAARKCDVIKGEIDVTPHGEFFVVKFTIGVKTSYPTHWDNVTKKTLNSLPDNNEGIPNA